ncbi:MAG: hypothetical protein ACOC4K_01085 [Verrucomicrobiota bacterium]
MNPSATTKVPTALSPSAWIKVGLLTALFVGAYFVLRALPDAQCGFLAYEEVVGPDGTVEFCATNHAGFLDLSRLDYPMEIEGLEMEGAGAEKRVSLELETHGGMPVLPHELAVTHTKKMHVMVIDASLEDYHHVHPEPVGLDGRYAFDFTPRREGPYRVFAEIVPLRSRRQLIATAELPVPGEARTPDFSHSAESVVGEARFRLEGLPETLRTGRDYRFELDVSTVEGEALELEEVMGAKGHMVAFDASRKGFAHMHPVDSIVGASGSDDLAFLFNVPNSGWYRLFAQVQIDGADVYGRFDLKVE